MQMSILHEEYLAGLTGGRRTAASGSQWRDQGDTRDNHLAAEPAFCLDGKSTRGDSIAVTRIMLDKIREQAQGERPGIGLRWYDNDRLSEIGYDLVAVWADDFAELLQLARAGMRVADGTTAVPSAELQQLQARAEELERQRAGLLAELDAHRQLLKEARNMPPAVIPPSDPRPPGLADVTIVYGMLSGGEPRMVHQGVHVTASGMHTTFPVTSLRIERDYDNKPRLMVNETIVRRGEYYLDGKLQCRVGIGPPVG
jgi:hypothetical protein